jgi:hypothetical protein
MLNIYNYLKFIYEVRKTAYCSLNPFTPKNVSPECRLTNVTLECLQANRIHFCRASWTETNGDGPMWLKAVQWYQPQSKTNGTCSDRNVKTSGKGNEGGPFALLSHLLLVLWISEFWITYSRGQNQRHPLLFCVSRGCLTSVQKLWYPQQKNGTNKNTEINKLLQSK